MEHWKKKISLFLTSQAISLFGSSLVQYAIIWYITLETQSGIMMTLSTICGIIPQVLISLFAGVWADKYNKKFLIMISDGMIAFSTLLIAILFLMGYDFMWLLFIVLIIRSLGTGIQTPTTSALIPELVPEKELMRVNGVNMTIQSIMLIVSPAVSGALLASVPLEYIFFIDVITAIIGISIFSLVKTHYVRNKNQKVEYLKSIREGLAYTKQHKFISRMLIYLVIANALVTPIAILAPLYVTRTFGAATWFLTWNEIIFFVGNVIGGIIISTWGGFQNHIRIIGLGCLICGVFAILIGIPWNFIGYLICMGLIGVTMPIINTPFITILQERVDADKYGRVFSLVTIVSGAIMPLAMILYGPLADFVDIRFILIITGILFLLATIALIKDKVIMRYVGENDKSTDTIVRNDT